MGSRVVSPAAQYHYNETHKREMDDLVLRTFRKQLIPEKEAEDMLTTEQRKGS